MSEARTSQGKAWLSYGVFLLPLLVLYPGYADLYARYQIFLALATLPLLIWLWRKENRLPLERPAAILIGLIFAGYVISVWRNGALPSSAGWRFFFLGVCLLLTYAVGLWATTRDQAWRIALAGLWGAHLLLCLQLWVHFAFFSADVTNWRLAVPGVFHLRHLGFGLSLALVAGFACLHHLLKKDWRQAAGLCLLLTIFASVLLWSGSRAGLLACAGGLAVFFLLARKDTLHPFRR